MRTALSLCGLLLVVLSGVAYTSRAQDDPGFNFPPYDAPPQAKIQFYENEIKKCKDYLDELSIGINKATILLRNEQDKNPHLFAGFNWSMEISKFEREVEVVCFTIKLHQNSIQTEMDSVPPPASPTPTPSPDPIASPSPKTETKSDQASDPQKNKLIGEYNEEIKFIGEYRKKLKEVKTGMSEVLKEIDDYVKTGKTKEPTPGFNAETTSTGGLWITTFTVPHGRLIVNLPADIRAGDTISGTVLAEPNGNTDAERTLNRDALNQYEVSLAIPRSEGSRYIWQEIVTTPNRQPGQPLASFDTVIHPSPAISGAAAATVTYKASEATFTIQRPGVYELDSEMEATFRHPTVGQDGRPAETRGPFDGNLRNTEIKVGGQPVSILAESPRSCVFTGPKTIGPAEVTVKEGKVETKGTYRNLGLRLAAPKTSLLRGETTVLTITVEGLKGIQHNVPLQLQKAGVVSMAGGDTQTVQIRPTDVRADGTFETKRTLTGLQAGGFGVTATVIDPAHRPVIIPLTENAKVNGFRVRKDGDKFVMEVEGVQSPITGKPVDGEHKLEHQCPTLSKLPYFNSLFLDKGAGRSTANCLEIMITPKIIIQDEQ